MNGDKTKAKKLTYLQMVTDAIATMKERSGSSRKAIAKHIIDTHKIEEAKVVHIRKAIATIGERLVEAGEAYWQGCRLLQGCHERSVQGKEAHC